MLEDARLVTSEKLGRVRRCRLGPRRLDDERAFMAKYEEWLEARLDRLGQVLEKMKGEEA